MVNEIEIKRLEKLNLQDKDLLLITIDFDQIDNVENKDVVKMKLKKNMKEILRIIYPKLKIQILVIDDRMKLTELTDVELKEMGLQRANI